MEPYHWGHQGLKMVHKVYIKKPELSGTENDTQYTSKVSVKTNVIGFYTKKAKTIHCVLLGDIE